MDDSWDTLVDFIMRAWKCNYCTFRYHVSEVRYTYGKLRSSFSMLLQIQVLMYIFMSCLEIREPNAEKLGNNQSTGIAMGSKVHRILLKPA